MRLQQYRCALYLSQYSLPNVKARPSEISYEHKVLKTAKDLTLNMAGSIAIGLRSMATRSTCVQEIQGKTVSSSLKAFHHCRFAQRSHPPTKVLLISNSTATRLLLSLIATDRHFFTNSQGPIRLSKNLQPRFFPRRPPECRTVAPWTRRAVRKVAFPKKCKYSRK